MADPASAREVLREITQREGLDCLQGLSGLLDRLKTARGVDLARAFDIVDELDRTGRPYWRKAAHDYYAGTGRLTNYQASRIWAAVGDFIVQLAEAYEYCLATYETGASGSAALRSNLLRMIGRAVRLRVSALGWDYVRYATQFGSWSELYRLYQLAEHRGCADQKVVLYRGGRLCTIEQEFMQALMLAVAAPHSMLPEQIDVADRITARVAQLFALADGPSARGARAYYFDPASNNPPARELPGIRPPFTARRFGPGDAEAELRSLLHRAERGELRLSEIGVDRHSEDIVVPTLQHLIRYWCDAPPERRHSRRREPQRIAVSHGFEEVVAKVGNLPTAYPFVSAQETWLVENSAEGGIGALVASPHGAWVSVGSLVAFRYPEASLWNLGIVRHLSEEKVDRFIGIELVSRGGVAVSLRRANVRGGAAAEDCLGVWLAGDPSQAGGIRLLVPHGMHSPSAKLHMRVHEREYVLAPGALVAAGPDYQIALYSPGVAPAGDA